MDKEEKDSEKEALTIDDFYDKVQKATILWNEKQTLCYITSRSTSENLHIVQMLCSDIKNICQDYCKPVEGNSETSVKSKISAFKYLICNTSFPCQSLLANDTAIGHLVDIQPPFSPYLFIAIIWDIGFENILAEAVLYIPLDLIVDVLEILQRCIDLFDFERASKFLSQLIFNTYKQLIVIKDIGCQTEDVIQNSKRLASNLQEIILHFTNERFLEQQNAVQESQYKNCGVLLKIILKMVRKCFTSKSEKVDLEPDMQKMYKLTFGWKSPEKISDEALQELLTEIDRQLINLLLTKVKEIDCNIYLNWIEHNDEEDPSLTLQYAIGLECNSFIEILRDFNDSNDKEFNHLLECLGQLAIKPHPKEGAKNLQSDDVSNGPTEESTLDNDVVNLLQRPEELDISLLSKDVCLDLIQRLAEKLDCAQEQSDVNKLQTSILTFIKASIHLSITDLYEITIMFILKFSENEKMSNIVDIRSFENFIIHSPYFSNAQNLRVILFFLCLSTKPTMKILLKMAIEHCDYPHVALSHDDLILLLPVLKIRTLSKFDGIMEDLCRTENDYQRLSTILKEQKPDNNEPDTVALVVQILQEICLEGSSSWNTNKFTKLISLLYSFGTVSEIAREIFIPMLASTSISTTNLKCILVELHKLIGDSEFKVTPDLAFVLQRLAEYLLDSNHISKYLVDELSTLITELIDNYYKLHENNEADCTNFFALMYQNSSRFNLLDTFGIFMSMYTNKYPMKEYRTALPRDKILGYLFLKCTKKQYLKYAEEIITSYGNFFKWSTLSEIYDNIIRVTFETCLFCLEFPALCSSNNISFLIHCLAQFLETENNSKKNKIGLTLCKSLSEHISILQCNISGTAISKAYAELLSEWKKSGISIQAYLNTLKQFSFTCTKKNGRLRAFNGSHSPLAIKLLLAYNIITSVVHDDDIINNEKQINKLFQE